MITRSVALLLLVVATIGGCRTRPTETGRLSVIASFYPLQEFAQRTAGDRAVVRNLTPAGTEPHDFEPTPQNVVRLKQANVLIYNGAGFEPWVERLLPELSASTVQVNATASLPLVRGALEEDAKAGQRPDPHVWLDPVLAAQQVDLIVAGLAKADPRGRTVFEGNAARVKDDLDALHRRYVSTLAACRRRRFITSHAAFGYLARRYALTQVAITGLDPETEPSPARLKQIILEARRTGARVIYYETLVNPRVAEVIAREVGARTAVLNPIEGLTPDGRRRGENYFTLMAANLKALAEGLDCH